MKGFVYLVGAGCRTRESLTLRGLACLGQADAVVYDDLLAPGLLEWASEKTERYYVGKRNGRHSMPQEEINALLVRLGQAGRIVCRLKGGDPFVFGRGGEEALALRSAGIPFEVVPGVTSAVAIPALAGIPVTHRGVSQSLHIITAHTADTADGLPADLPKLAKLGGTLVFLMGLSQLPLLTQRLMEYGMPPQTPAAVLEESSYCGTLQTIARNAASAKAPAVIVVGAVAGMKLTGPPKYVVGLTGTPSFQSRMQSALTHPMLETICIQQDSLTEICPPEAFRAALAENPKWLVFTSPNGVDCFFRCLRTAGLDIRTLSHVRIAVVGPGTARVLAEHGIIPDLMPEIHNTQALAAALAASAQGSVLLAGAENASPAPEIALTEAGIPHRRLNLYRIVPGRCSDSAPDYLIFGSRSGVLAHSEAAGAKPKRGTLCIGERTAQAARTLGYPNISVAEDATPNAMKQKLLEEIEEWEV